MRQVILFALSLLLLDAVFITGYMRGLYKEAFGINGASLLYAALAYAAMASSWSLIRGDLKKAALVGFVIYGTYAFTLKAIFPRYTSQMMVSEVIWGMTLFTLATWIAVKS
jgi:uncharacterized membrane protein